VSKLSLFAVIVALAFGGAYALGATVDPDPAGDGDDGHGESPRHGADHDVAEVATRPAKLVVDEGEFRPGAAQPLTFRVIDRAGRTVRDFDVAHERAMHVIAVRHDLTGYRHLHPRQLPDGSWTVDATFAEAGPQRVYADFVVDGEPRTLSADVSAVGRYAARPLPAPRDRAATGGGYVVEAVADGDERRYAVTRDGEPVDDLQPYLGARGHLVALREHDLAFQHVHPKDAATTGRDIAFDVELAGSGRHRLFLQFKHDGEVRTVAFTERGAGAASPGGRDDSDHDDHGEARHGH
jgi:hypothetical protein